MLWNLDDSHEKYMLTLSLLEKRAIDLIDEIQEYRAHPMDLHNRTLSGTPARMWALESQGVRRCVGELRKAIERFEQDRENVQEALFLREEE